MSANNPSITASSIIVDVESRLGTPNISTTSYLPWISYAYQRTYAALANAGQRVKETLFGNYTTLSLTANVAEYSLSTNIPRFASLIKIEVVYGASGDQRVRAMPLNSIASWRNQGNVSTSYRSKTEPLFYILEDTLGFIPTPDGGTAYIWYVRRPYQIDTGSDVIDIDYRFIYPIVDYVQAKAIEKENEDYSESARLELKFQAALQEIVNAAVSEYNENDGDGIAVSSDNAIFEDPLRW